MIKAVRASTASPPVGSTRTPSPVCTTRRTAALRRMSASVACAAIDSINLRVPFSSFVADNAASSWAAFHDDKAHSRNISVAAA